MQKNVEVDRMSDFQWGCQLQYASVPILRQGRAGHTGAWVTRIICHLEKLFQAWACTNLTQAGWARKTFHSKGHYEHLMWEKKPLFLRFRGRVKTSNQQPTLRLRMLSTVTPCFCLQSIWFQNRSFWQNCANCICTLCEHVREYECGHLSPNSATSLWIKV